MTCDRKLEGERQTEMQSYNNNNNNINMINNNINMINNNKNSCSECNRIKPCHSISLRIWGTLA